MCSQEKIFKHHVSFPGIHFPSSYITVRCKSLKDDLRGFLKKPLKKQLENKRWLKKRDKLEFMIGEIDLPPLQPSQTSSSSLLSVPSSQISMSSLLRVPSYASSSCQNLSIIPDDYKNINSVVLEEALPSFMDLTGSDDEGSSKDALPAWTKRLSDPTEIARQKFIEEKILAGRKKQQAETSTERTADPHYFGRTKKTAEPDVQVHMETLLPKLIQQEQELQRDQQSQLGANVVEASNELDESAGQYAMLIVNTLMTIDVNKRQQAFNDVLRLGNNYQ